MSIQVARGTKSNLQSVNPLLKDGQICIEQQIGGGQILKIGDGTTLYNDLDPIVADPNGIISTDHGGTGADNVVSARENLGFTYGTEVPTETPLTGEGSIYYQVSNEDNLKQQIVDIVYPIGSYYISNVATSPETLFPGTTWQRVVDKFLYATTSNETGGSSTVTLSNNELPKHNHYLPAKSTESSGSHTHSRGTMDIKGTVTFRTGDDLDIILTEHLAGAFGRYGPESWSGTHAVFDTSAKAGCYQRLAFQASDGWTGETSAAPEHTHRFLGSYSNESGSGNPFSIMPPYKGVYAWYRIT